MVWIRPGYHRDAWPEGDDRRLVNLEDYYLIRVSETRPEEGKTFWIIEALTHRVSNTPSPIGTPPMMLIIDCQAPT